MSVQKILSSRSLKSARRPLSRLLQTATGAVLAGAVWAQAAAVAVDISAQPLDQALRALARQTGAQIVFSTALTENRVAPAIKGTLTPAQALDQLLQGSGLQASSPDNTSFTVQPARRDETTLKPVPVQDSALQVPADTARSYTVGASRSATGLTLALRDTPQSLSVITRERMDDQSMNTVADAVRHTTGVALTPVDRGRNTLTARGFDISTFQFDGIPVDTTNVGIETSSTAIYDRIEIIRGANGLLNGPGDPSAVVNLVRKRADGREFAGAISIETGSWDRYAGTADLSAPITADASVRGRFVAHVERSDAFIDLERTDSQVYYGVIDVDLAERTQLSVGASYQRDERSGVLWVGFPYWYTDGSRTDFSRSKTSATRWNQWDTTEQTAFASIQHTLRNDWSIRADIGWHKQIENSKLLWASGEIDRVTGLGMEGDTFHYLSKPEEQHLGVIAGGPFTLFGRQHELTTGLTYSNLKDGWSNRDTSGPVMLPDFNNWDGSFPDRPLGPSYTLSIGETTQSAAYAAARLQLADPLKVIAGARVSNWKRENKNVQPHTRQQETGVVTPYFGVIYDITEQLSAYASYTDIFKSQNTYRDRNGTALDPVEGKNYEAGLKAELLDGGLNASAAVFEIKQDNLAVEDAGFLVPGTTEQAFRGARGVETKGYELEVTGAVAERWDLTVGWTHFSAKDADDEDVAKTHPRKMLRLFTKYTLAGALNGLSVGGGVDWQSEELVSATNPGTGVDEKFGQGGYALVNLMAKYAFDEHVSLQLNVDNLFDKTYRYGNFWGTFTYGEPRRVTATLDYRF